MKDYLLSLLGRKKQKRQSDTDNAVWANEMLRLLHQGPPPAPGAITRGTIQPGAITMSEMRQDALTMDEYGFLRVNPDVCELD